MLNITSLDIPFSGNVINGSELEEEEQDEGVFDDGRCRDSDVLEIRDGYWHRSPLLGELQSNLSRFPI